MPVTKAQGGILEKLAIVQHAACDHKSHLTQNLWPHARLWEQGQDMASTERTMILCLIRPGTAVVLAYHHLPHCLSNYIWCVLA